jgi:hypothetical protein
MFNFKSILGIGAASLLAANAVAQQPHKLAQKDIDARWTKKNNILKPINIIFK